MNRTASFGMPLGPEVEAEGLMTLSLSKCSNTSLPALVPAEDGAGRLTEFQTLD